MKQEDLGLIPAQIQWFFFSPWVVGGRKDMDADTANCVIHVDKRSSFLAVPSSGSKKIKGESVFD